jgi:hypothetical protein
MSGLVVGNAVAIQYIAGEGAVTTAAYVAIAVVLLKRAKNPQSLVERDASSSMNQGQPVPVTGR